jgi:hypothetical protein
MYSILLSLHNIFRWAVLLAALWAVYRFVTGWLGRRQFTSADASASKFYTISLDVQFLIGLILLFVSPLIQTMFADFGGSMKVPELRRIGMEHTILMLAAVTLGHIGGAMAKKNTDDATRFKKGSIFFILSLIALLAGIPWWRGIAGAAFE